MEYVIEKMFLQLWQYYDCIDVSRHASIPGGTLTALDAPVFLFDASFHNSRIPIPRRFCKSKENFHQLVEFLFQGRSWHSKIRQHEYLLEDKELQTDIESTNWDTQVVPGAFIYMTMIFKSRGHVAKSSCRVCRAKNIKQIGRKNKIQCLNCGCVSDDVESQPNHFFGSANNYIENDIYQPSGQDAEIFKLQDFRRIRFIHRYDSQTDERDNPNHEELYNLTAQYYHLQVGQEETTARSKPTKNSQTDPLSIPGLNLEVRDLLRQFDREEGMHQLADNPAFPNSLLWSDLTNHWQWRPVN